MSTALGDQRHLRDLLLKDTLARVGDTTLEVDVVQAVLSNLEIYVEMTRTQPLPALLMQCGTSLILLYGNLTSS
jgi:hypothetical protein